jgi:hypothetical protein
MRTLPPLRRRPAPATSLPAVALADLRPLAPIPAIAAPGAQRRTERPPTSAPRRGVNRPYAGRAPLAPPPRVYRAATAQLKHRAENDYRTVPCHPRLAELLDTHIKVFGVAPDGRLFTGTRGGPLADSMTSLVWRQARKSALSQEDYGAGIALRPYDLRHACVTSWLNAGVDPAQVAAWAGHSVTVLMRVYVRCIVGRDEVARRRIEAAFRDDEEETLAKEHSPEPESDPG